MAAPDVIVIGLGVMGLSTCAALAERGVRVLGIDQFDIGHAMGSSHGATRIFRTAYFEHPDYVPLLKRSHELWRELEEQAGERLLIDTPALYMGPAESALVRGSIESARRHSIDVESLGFDDIRRRFAQFALPEGTIGILENAQTTGMILAERSLAVLARLALERGGELRTGERVISWSATDSGVRVETEQAEYEASRLIVCGGPWSARLLEGLGLPLRVTRQVSACFEPRRPEPFAHPGFPIWALESANGIFHYGFPLHNEDVGMKVACHDPGPTFDPTAPDRRCEREEAGGVVEFMRRHIPEAAGQVLKAQLCLYTMTPDAHFVIDRHPQHANVHFACGFSGHGFKFAPVAGEVLADLAMEGSSRHPIGFLSLKRFEAKRPPDR